MGPWLALQVAVVTAVFGKRDILHPPAATAFPDKVCYVAFLDDETMGFLQEKGFQVGSTCEGWQVSAQQWAGGCAGQVGAQLAGRWVRS